MIKSISSIALAVALCVSGPALGDENEGRRLAELTFDSVDEAGRGYLDQGQFVSFGGDIFTSMDADDSMGISLGEFLAWDFGFQGVAEEKGRLAAYETAMRVLYAFWDRDGDGSLSKRDWSRSVAADFARADANDDALLMKDEFLDGFTVIIAARAAINPAPINQ